MIKSIDWWQAISCLVWYVFFAFFGVYGTIDTYHDPNGPMLWALVITTGTAFLGISIYATYVTITEFMARERWRKNHDSTPQLTIELNNGVVPGRTGYHVSTCNDCPGRLDCEFAGDPYNTNGDCLAEK